MKKIVVIILIVLIGVIILMNIFNKENKPNLERTGWAKPIPESYKMPSNKKGTLVNIEYPSIDYTNNKKITKEAVVYLPYNYDKNKKYNIFYEMHGWTGHAGEIFEDGVMKNVLDNMIENKEIEPLIFVSATFDSDNQSQSWTRSTEELEPFHLDFENNLMPYVESHYSTYANSTTKEDLIASRNHRAFGGFSLGGVTTWWMFKYDLDYIKYFLPMSGDAWYKEIFGGLYDPKGTVDEVEKIVKNNTKDYFIYAGLGTNDARYDQVNNQMVEMLKRDTFKNTFVYYQIKDAYHDLNAAQIDLYNGLQMFYK